MKQYHYTSLLHLPFILLDNQLAPSRRDAHGNHRAGLLWFSQNARMEPTARKGDIVPVRFRSTNPSIVAWRQAARAVGFESGTMRRLERSGRAVGATPGQWRAKIGGLIRPDNLEIRLQGEWKHINPGSLKVAVGQRNALELWGAGGLVLVSGRQRTEEGYFLYASAASLYTPDNLLTPALAEAG